MKKQNQSLDQLSKSLDRRSRHLMVQTLQRFEDSFPDVDNTRQGQVFKADLRNMFNDVMRAQRDELNDYEVEYRPLRMTDNGTLAMTQSFMQTVQKVEFGSRGSIPFMKIYSSTEYSRVLDAIRIEFDAGVLHYNTPQEVILEVVGAHDCVSVLNVMDRYRLHEKTGLIYREWRSKVVKVYQEQG